MPPSNKRRVVVTGLGIVSPIGNTVQENWAHVTSGKSGISKITKIDFSLCPAQIAGEVKDFDPTTPFKDALYPNATSSEKGEPLTQPIHKKEVKKMGRFIQLAMQAGVDAYIDSGLDANRSHLLSDHMGVNIGVGMGGLPEIEAVHSQFLTKGFGRITPFFIPMVIPNLAAGNLSIALNFKGPNLCNVTACSSSAHSIGEALRAIQNGYQDVMLTGGTEAVICNLAMGGFAAMKALSTRNDDPEKASRPYDINRDGFVMGEGAACLVLEEYEHAKKRGARIYSELVGYGLSADAYHITLPAPEGEGGFRAMKLALKDASISAEEIGYINAHGTSTPAGDAEEAKAIHRLYSSNPKQLHISSTKSMTGHLLGAAGAVEALFSILALKEGIIPPTLNLDELDPACKELGMDFTPHKAIEKKAQYALSNSFGFGGTNACLIFKSF